MFAQVQASVEILSPVPVSGKCCEKDYERLNTRASGSDDALRLIPISKLSLEGCLEFLAQDELLEVTPENLRIRKQILNHEQRMKAKSKMK